MQFTDGYFGGVIGGIEESVVHNTHVISAVQLIHYVFTVHAIHLPLQYR